MSEFVVWVSKYALSSGIGVVVVTSRTSHPEWVGPAGSYSEYKLGRDAHLTEAAASQAAEAMRLKKIASLKKQIGALEKLSFEVAP